MSAGLGKPLQPLGSGAVGPWRRGVPGGSLPPPPASPWHPLPSPRGGGSWPRGGSEFPWPPSGPVNFSPGSAGSFAPRGRLCSHSAGQLSARVRTPRSWAYLPRGVWKPTGGTHTSWERQGRRRAGSVSGLGWVGGYLQLQRACLLPFVLRRPRWMRCDRGVQAWAVQIKSS